MQGSRIVFPSRVNKDLEARPEERSGDKRGSSKEIEAEAIICEKAIYVSEVANRVYQVEKIQSEHV